MAHHSKVFRGFEFVWRSLEENSRLGADLGGLKQEREYKADVQERGIG
jgi:hypothetical protein